MENNDNTKCQASANIVIAIHVPKTLWLSNPNNKLLFDTLLGLNYEILWIKLFKLFFFQN